MKKLFCTLVAIISCAVCLLADNNSCRVYGATNGNVASIMQKSSKAGDGKIYIYVALTKPAEENTTIAVDVKDGTSQIGTAHVTISKGSKTPNNGWYYYENKNLIKGKSYTFSISNASCD